MRRAARAIIIKDNQLLVMRRNKFGSQYVTLPGGKIELGETAEQAARREIQEETGIVFTDPRLVFVEHAGLPYGDQYIFVGDYQSGEPQLHEDSEERKIHDMGQNLYQPGWLPLDQLASANFLSKELQQAIINCLKDGWPAQPLEFTSKRNV